MKARLLAAGLAIAAVVVAVGVAALDGGGDDCARSDTQLSVVSGPVGWTAAGLVETRTEAGTCQDRVSLALYAPGDTWESEGWAPVWVDVATLPHRDVDASYAWEPSGDRLVLRRGGRIVRVVYVESLPAEDHAGRFRICDADAPATDPVDWSALPSHFDGCVVRTTH